MLRGSKPNWGVRISYVCYLLAGDRKARIRSVKICDFFCLLWRNVFPEDRSDSRDKLIFTEGKNSTNLVVGTSLPLNFREDPVLKRCGKLHGRKIALDILILTTFANLGQRYDWQEQ